MNKLYTTIILCLLAALLFAFGQGQENEVPPLQEEETSLSVDTENVRYEIPRSTKERAEILLEQYGYTVSYNPDLCIPNWVAWELNAEKLVERESRNSKFVPNPKLPEDMAVTTKEYTGSGWDRGHMCPAGDNKYHWRAMNESFYMTNICPQNHNLNRGDWKELEEACRRWAEAEPVYIACGPIMYKTPKYGYIGKKFKIRVPDAFFKVVLTGLQSGKPRAIGFIYKNESGNNKRDKYVNSVDEVERITSMDFFSALPDDVERRVESEYKLSDWP
ncbi:MAG: DNA/RNA non-specific endonuclease [Bacteroidaceae bacterium]|nr:DNA/RNA non-specific endonuclease [Bacteroidaceae bacterium]